MNKPFAIFDMDGTLVSSMGYWRNLGRNFLAMKGVTENVDDTLERIKPLTLIESSEVFINTFGLEGTPESVEAEMKGIMEEHYRTDIPMKENVKEYLDILKARGVRMCVASATPEKLSNLCLRRLGLYDYFEFVISCEAVGVGKNSPAVYLECLNRLGADTASTAVYEDAFFAGKTAKEAGFYTIAVKDANSARHWDELAAIADEKIEDWHAAAELL